MESRLDMKTDAKTRGKVEISLKKKKKRKREGGFRTRMEYNFVLNPSVGTAHIIPGFSFLFFFFFSYQRAQILECWENRILLAHKIFNLNPSVSRQQSESQRAVQEQFILNEACSLWAWHIFLLQFGSGPGLIFDLQGTIQQCSIFASVTNMIQWDSYVGNPQLSSGGDKFIYLTSSRTRHRRLFIYK